MNWLFVKKLNNIEYISEFEREKGYEFPKEFKEVVENYNGAYPENNCFDTETVKENVIQKLISFNKEDRFNMWDVNFKSDYSSEEYVIFAVGDFGDFICFDKSNNHVVCLNHETMKIEKIADSFIEFVEKLYK